MHEESPLRIPKYIECDLADEKDRKRIIELIFSSMPLNTTWFLLLPRDTTATQIRNFASEIYKVCKTDEGRVDVFPGVFQEQRVIVTVMWTDFKIEAQGFALEFQSLINKVLAGAL